MGTGNESATRSATFAVGSIDHPGQLADDSVQQLATFFEVAPEHSIAAFYRNSGVRRFRALHVEQFDRSEHALYRAPPLEPAPWLNSAKPSPVSEMFQVCGF